MKFDDPLWVQAWATAALFGAAVVAGIAACWVLWVELRRDKRRRLDVRAEQAGQVAAWVELRDRRPVGSSAPHPLWHPRGHYCILYNSSSLPVYRVHLRYALSAAQDWEDIDDVLQEFDLLPPGEHTKEIPEAVLKRFKELEDWGLRVAIEFTDAAGNEWVRSAMGVLTEAPPQHPPLPWHLRVRHGLGWQWHRAKSKLRARSKRDGAPAE